MKPFSIFNKPKQENIFELYPDGIIVVSRDGKILDANEKAIKILDVLKTDLTGAYFSQYVQGGSGLLNKLVSGNNLSVSKVSYPDKSQKDDLWVEVSASKSEENDKVYVAIRDVTKNYKMQNMINGEFEIAKKIIDEKNLFLKGVSSEIFSLMNSIVNFSKALNDGVGGALSDKQKKYASIINKSSSELCLDLERLFKYFEVESNLYNYEYKKFDMGDLLTTVSKSLEVPFARKKLSFLYDFSSFITRSAYQDAIITESIVRTILDISLKGTDIGTISMNVGNPPLEFLESKGYDVSDENIKKKYAMFEIKDSGLVLPDDVLDNIFNPYYINDSVTKKMLGAKLAFSYVYKHVKNLKGDMWVYSKPSQGTLTCILLPMEKA